MQPVSSSRGQRRKGLQAAGSLGPDDNTAQMGEGRREERKEDPGEGIWGLSFKRGKNGVWFSNPLRGRQWGGQRGDGWIGPLGGHWYLAVQGKMG